jgi:DNA-binding GntR family transcriptional regulator
MAHPAVPPRPSRRSRAIVDALDAADAERAAEASAFHVRQAARTVLDALGAQANDETRGS